MSKPTVVLEIEKVLEASLVEARVRPGGDRIGSLKVLKRSTPRYAFDEAGKRLIGLNLADTNLTNEQWQALLKISGLQFGDVRVLNLSDNQLTEFRLTDEMRNLEWLNIEDNPLTFPAEEMIKQGQEATLTFLKSFLTQGERDVYEVKMLIVGEGETGKTTLWKKLQDPSYMPDGKEDSTVGIGIKEGWSFSHVDQPDITFFVNLWDFGGQEIQYMTHQFFLTRRSFYVLLADGRREVANFAYWFKIINLLGCEEKQEKKLPVLVVLNEKGNSIAKMPYDPTKVKSEFSRLDIHRREVDFAKRDGRFSALVDSIKDFLCHHLEHLPIKMPSYWDNVRKKLYILRESSNHISWTDFETLCKEEKMEDPKEMVSLSQLLHDLGVILHFQEDIQLRDFIVLKPEWAANAVYEVFRHKEVADQQGRFVQQLLAEVWTEGGYSVREQGHLLNLMLKDNLEVCFPTEEAGKTLFIAPQLLTEVRPTFMWEPGVSALRHIYQYPFMPKGLIGRLIVRLNKYLVSGEDQKKVLWEKGMLLKDEQDTCHALVQETTNKATGGTIIQMEIIGTDTEDRRNLLRDIRRELDHIHNQSFPSLKFEEQIPCCCAQCLTSDIPNVFDLSVLEDWSKENEKIPCMKSKQFVSIQDLLKGVVEADIRSMNRKIQSASSSPKVFLSYSRHDREKLESLQRYLAPLKRKNKIELWDDHYILPGDEWDGKIREELEQADIILLLVSSFFLDTDYVWDVEIARAMERHESGSARVIPIVLDDCDWEDAPFGKLNGLPRKGKPVSDYERESKAWTEVVQAIKKIIA